LVSETGCGEKSDLATNKFELFYIVKLWIKHSNHISIGYGEWTRRMVDNSSVRFAGIMILEAEKGLEGIDRCGSRHMMELRMDPALWRQLYTARS
jgi:hypothetical protein